MSPDDLKLKLKAQYSVSDVVSRYVPELRQDGVEHKACCPFHDERTPSFTVNDAKGFYHCFGCGAHGDIIGFVQEHENVGYIEAMRLISGQAPPSQEERKKRESKRVDYYSDYIPLDLPDIRVKPNEPIKVINPKRDHKVSTLKPEQVYVYEHGYVFRLNYKDKKITPTIRWCKHKSGVESWVMYPFSDSERRHYGRIKPKGQIIIVEGEKAADVGIELMRDSSISVITWAGGTNAVDKTNWSFLANRSVILLPDNDVEGHKAMVRLSELLPSTTNFKFCEPDTNLEKGWDIADVEWNYSEFIKWCKQHIVSGLSLAGIVRNRKIELPPIESYESDQTPPPEVLSIPTSKKIQKDTDLDWPDPVDLFSTLEPPEMDRTDLPLVLSNYIEDQSELLGSDFGVIGMTCLASCASLISDQIRVQPKQFDTGWKESARIWVAIVGDPSTKKTPAINKGIRHVKRISDELHDATIKANAQYEYDLLKHKEDCKAAKKSGEPFPEKPTEPLQRQLIIEDTTIEAMSDVLADNSAGILCYQDELTQWFGSMDAYRSAGGGKDRGLWLSAYNGGSRVINRVSRGKINIPNWSASMIGGIQPEAIQALAKKMNHDGLLQRFMPYCARPASPDTDRIPDHSAIDEYKKLCDHLFNVQPSSKPIEFSSDANSIRLEVERFAMSMSAHNQNGHLKAWFGKWAGLFSRLSVIYHCCECYLIKTHPCQTPITAETAAMVKRLLMRVICPHALFFYNDVLGTGEAVTTAQSVARWILSAEITEFTLSQAGKFCKKFQKSDHHERVSVIKTLEFYGWIESGFGRLNAEGKATGCLVNPKVHVIYAGQALAEREKRKQAKEELMRSIEEMKEYRDEE